MAAKMKMAATMPVKETVEKETMMKTLKEWGFPPNALEVVGERTDSEIKKLVDVGGWYRDWFADLRDKTVVTGHGDDSCRFFLKSLKPRFLPSTLWTNSTYAKDYISFRHGQDRKSYPNTTAFLKTNAKGYQGKKALFLTFSEWEEFWADPEQEKDLLGVLRKVLSLCGYYAADRSVETAYLLMKDVVLDLERRTVEIATVKRKGDKMRLLHTIVSTKKFDCVTIFEKYLAGLERLKLGPGDRFFKQFDHKSKNLKKQNVGEKYLSTITIYVAEYWKKPNPEKYTSQGNRAACATTMFESGAPTEHIAKHGAWASKTVMDGYIRPSKRFRDTCAEFASGGKENVMYGDENPDENVPKPAKKVKKSEEDAPEKNPCSFGGVFSTCKFSNCEFKVYTSRYEPADD
jgi:integrase